MTGESFFALQDAVVRKLQSKVEKNPASLKNFTHHLIQVYEILGAFRRTS